MEPRSQGLPSFCVASGLSARVKPGNEASRMVPDCVVWGLAVQGLSIGLLHVREDHLSDVACLL